MLIFLLILIIVVIFGPQFWAKRILKKYSRYREDFPGTGGEFAQHLLAQFKMYNVKVEISETGDHYDPIDKTVRLIQSNLEGKSLTAVATAAHEVGHAIQDNINYQPFQTRIKLIQTAQIMEKLGAGLMVMIPVVAIFTHIPALGILMFIGGLMSLGTAVIVHLVTLPVELDASFRRALPILANYISKRDQWAARRILTACALTYVASSLTSLLNLWRWLAILRR
ncbi:MAG: zinc metallopeptidase [Candidatus Marithrix sp.]